MALVWVHVIQVVEYGPGVGTPKMGEIQACGGQTWDQQAEKCATIMGTCGPGGGVWPRVWEPPKGASNQC